MPVTMREVARRAGVSLATVSYVLNGGPRPVSAEKTERVLAAVREFGYQDGGTRPLTGEAAEGRLGRPGRDEPLVLAGHSRHRFSPSLACYATGGCRGLSR